MKLVLTVLLLIVLPTALLSLLAGHSLQAREYLLERQLEQEAEQQLEQVGSALVATVRKEHEQITKLFAASVLGGADIRTFPEQAAAYRAQSPLVARLFLYMNPWGFVYPAAAARATERGDGRDPFVRLQQALMTRSSTERRMDGFWVGPHLYYFGPQPGEQEIYAGMELDVGQVAARVREMLQSHATGYITYTLLHMEPARGGGTDEKPADIEVLDSLSAQPDMLEAGSAFVRGRGRQDMLVVGRLRAPFDYMELGAYSVNAADRRHAHVMQVRLFRWGIFLLAVVIMTSTCLLILLARRQAQNARRRGLFMAGVSHDIRTPLAGMRALAESLRAGRVSSPERQQQFLDTIVQECDRLSRLVDRVLLFFRQEQRSAQYRKQPVELCALCERLAESFMSQYRGQVAVRLVCPEQRHCIVWGDPDALEQALYNLLDNARKYGRPQDQPSDAVSIRLAVRRQTWHFRRWIVVTVADQGPGVAGRERQRIFQRFYRGQTAGDAHAGGIGLGLSLVIEILRVHRARIVLQQEGEQGAAFALWFPVIRSKRAAGDKTTTGAG